MRILRIWKGSLVGQTNLTTTRKIFERNGEFTFISGRGVSSAA